MNRVKSQVSDENFSMLNSGICLDGCKYSNTSEPTVVDPSGNGILRELIGCPHSFNLQTEITARDKSKYSIFPETVTTF